MQLELFEFSDYLRAEKGPPPATDTNNQRCTQPQPWIIMPTLSKFGPVFATPLLKRWEVRGHWGHSQKLLPLSGDTCSAAIVFKNMPVIFEAQERGSIWSGISYLLILGFYQWNWTDSLFWKASNSQMLHWPPKTPWKRSKNISHSWQTSLQEHR